MSYGYAPKNTGWIISGLKNVIDRPLDPTLVDNTPKLLDILNKAADRLPKLLNKRDERGYTLLHFAAERNQPESLKCLLIKEANPNVRSAFSSNEVTPLHIAAGCGHLACLQLLVQSGGDIMVPDRRQLTPVDYANTSGQDLCLNYLHDVIACRQAEERREMEDILIQVERNLVADNVLTLSHWVLFNDLFPLSSPPSPPHQITQAESMMYRHCVLINNRNVVKVLNRVSKDIPISLHNSSLLHAACRYGRLELTHLLLEKVPKLMFSITDEGYNVLHTAVTHNQPEIVKLFIQAQIQRTHSQFMSSLTATPGEISCVDSNLLNLPLKFSTATLSGHTVLHFAVVVGNLEILSQLLKHYKDLQLGIDANECGYTALHLAVYLNNFEVVHMLLKRGANPNLYLDSRLEDRLSISRTPLTEAAINKNLQILNLLIEYGAEDKHHDALKVCLPSQQHQNMVVPLLGSLMKCDESYKPNKQMGRKDRRVKTGTLDWSHLQLVEVQPSWVGGCLPVASFLRAQNIESSRLFECVTSINISHNKLVCLPAEIFLLPKLCTLNASNNSIESLPEIQQVFSTNEGTYKWPCYSLTKIQLSKNALTFLPDFLFCLPSLAQLDLSHNLLRALPFQIWKTPKLYNFNCSHNELDSIPTNWPQVLNSCRVINTTSSPAPPPTPSANKKQRHSVPKALVETETKALPRFISSMDQSVLERHSGEEDRAEVTAVSKLQDRLNICNANLQIEWEAKENREEEYEGLAILNLANNYITQIPENFPCLCPKLTRLDLSHNQISSVSLPRCFPVTLKQINLAFNPISEIDCEHNLAKPLPCTNPQVLLEAGEEIHIDNVSFCCHRHHNHLTSLSVLELNNCQLHTVTFYTPQLLLNKTKAKQSTETDIVAVIRSGNSRKRAQNAHALARLVCPLLTRLILSHNQLMRVPESVCEMTSLNSLDLSHNEIIDLPAQLGRLSNLWEFPLNGLKLISPPHNIIERGKTKDIIGFLWSLLQRARPYHRMKLMLVGKAARGKTTLLEKISEKGQRGIQENWALARMMAQEKLKRGTKLSTVGIVVSDWTYYKKVRESQTSLKSITFMTWDFGGQEEYYATHQCFLSRRSLYLVVWRVTDGLRGAEELKPWLLNIQARAPHSPVIIVGTHLDKLSSKSQKMELTQSLEYIAATYGTDDKRREGYPQVMHSMVVSCKGSGKGINELRDVIFDVASQVKESTVSGRGIGCGRIPEYRLLMDQLVPASYLQLEDTVRNIALTMRIRGKPPVLTYKELRELVFADTRTLISKSSVDRELEQAVRFLHDNGTLLHYDDPLLSDFYFVDPQWLCDMLAHIVTVREINPLIRDGIMKIADFPLIFNDMEFPIRWQKKYIRLLTTFEVAVELGGGELLVPSMLPQQIPNLPQTVFPKDLKLLPPLRHTYIVPFIPNGFWPRLMSRVLTDPTITQLAKEGCGITDEDLDQLNWIKWRTGMILQYGNLTLLTIKELDGGLFPDASNLEGVKICSENNWSLHKKDIKIFGIDVVVPDIYPILKYPEVVVARKQSSKRNTPSLLSETSIDSRSTDLRPHFMTSTTTSVSIPIQASHDQSHDPQPKSHDITPDSHDAMCGNHGNISGVIAPQVQVSHTEGGVLESDGDSCAHRVVGIDQIDLEFEKLTKKRHRLLNKTSSSSSVVGEDTGSERSSSTSTLKSPSRAGSWEKHIRTNSFERPPSRAQEKQQAEKSHERLPHVDEDKNDVMRAGLLSKSIDHISVLIEDWFTGVRPRHLVVPCPSCSLDHPHKEIKLERSFSNWPSLLPEAERNQLYPPSQLPLSLQRSNHHARHHRDSFNIRPITSSLKNEQPVAETNKGQDSNQLQLNQDPYYYAFCYEDCVVMARSLDTMFCPAHGNVPLQYMAPDTLFLTEGKNVTVNSQDLCKEDPIGYGAFATVFKAKMKRKGEEGDISYQEVALKALTKEWKYADCYSIQPPDQDLPLPPSKPLTRKSILDGFSNLKKELSILSPLKHTHVIQLYGVMLRPLGLVLELAPRGSLKCILTSYADAQLHLQCNVSQAVVTQVASAIQYLHSCAILYRDLKSDNILVWQFPDPQDPIATSASLGMESVFVKLSDYGISQFAAIQGARGLVGTPGFMAPEILKYHGREVYTEQVDIFSFGMFIYELITRHIPYETLTAQQANQANESGARPSLTKKDFPCPVLLRELMVWCWQQQPDERPTAAQIILSAQTTQFLRLLDGIRVSNSGQVTSACVRMTTSPFSNHTLPRRRSRSHQQTPPLSRHNQGSNPNLTHSQVLDRNQISPVEQLTDSHSKSPKLSTKTPLTKVSNLESLCEEEATGDVFDSEAERVRVCPGMVGGEEHVFQQQSNGVKPTDRESASVVHSDHESTWIIQTDHESNDVTHNDHESNSDMHSDHNEVHEQDNENGVLGSTEDTVDQQTVTMTTTGPGSVTPADTAATESGMTLVAENGGICQLETGDDEMADIKKDQNLNFDQRSTETDDSQQNQVTAEDPQAKSTCNTEQSFSELQHTHLPQVGSRVSKKSSAATTLTRDSTGMLSDQTDSKGLTSSDLQSKQPFIATLDRQSEDTAAGGCGLSSLMPGRSISTPADPQDINIFDRDHEDAAASNVLIPPQSRVPRSHSMDSKLRVSSTNAGPLGFDRYQHLGSSGSHLRGSSEDLLARGKSFWSPRLTDRSSPSWWEDEPAYEIWVASSSAHHSVVTVIEYNGKFNSVEDIEVGDSSILCMCTVKDKVWMGFEIGYLLVFDTATKRPCAQAWLQQYTAILSILHIVALQRVYIGFENGSVLAFDDDLASAITTITPARIKLLPICEYHDTTQTSACLLAVPQVNSCSVPQPHPQSTSATSFEIWVGQKAGLITILDAEKLTVLKFLQNTVDLSRTPSYVAYLTYANLVCSISPEPAASSSNGPSEKTSGGVLAGNVVAECVSVYGALYHGQYVTRWSAESKTVVQSFNCEKHMEGKEECCISSLHFSNLTLYVGLTCGKVLILDAHSFNCLCTLSCHRNQVKSLFCIDLALLQQQDLDTFSLYEREKMERLSSSGSTPSVLHSTNPSPIHLSDRSPSLSSIQTVNANSRQLLSFGTGFRSYFDGPESKQYWDSGFLLVWESEHWNGDT